MTDAKHTPTPAKRAVQWAKRHGRPMDATVIEAYLAGNNALARSKIKPLVDALTTAVVAERTNFDLPHDWIHEASALIGSPVGEQFKPKRAQPSEVAALRNAHSALLREVEELRGALNSATALLAAAKLHCPNHSLSTKVLAPNGERLLIRGLQDAIAACIDTARAALSRRAVGEVDSAQQDAQGGGV